jgi:hypothetical protein
MTISLDKNSTQKIFKLLKEGKFLSQNTPDTDEKQLFNYLQMHFEEFQSLFSYLDITLILREGYCYFASFENRDQRIQSILKLIDLMSFYFHFDPTFGVGTRFSINDVEERINDDITLKTKFNKLKELKSDTQRNKIHSLIEKFEKRGYLALEDPFLERYVVLDSYSYLVSFFNKIEIKES